MLRIPEPVPVSLILFCAMAFLSLFSEPARAELLPDEVAVVVNASSPDSLLIGDIYSRLRGVPLDHLIAVFVQPQEHIGRKEYEDKIAVPVRKAIGMLSGQGKRIRCLVTTYGIPLRVGPVRPPSYAEDEIRKQEEALAEMKKRRSAIDSELKKDGSAQDSLKKKRARLGAEISELNLKLGALKGSDTAAAVDSELALVLSPDYPLAGWLPNPGYLPARGKVAQAGRVLMVSRLDGPTPELAQGLVRTAVKVEKQGLSGTFYLDARGLTGEGSYGQFDEDIRRTARILSPGVVPVVLDNRPALFGPGEAPSAALYCGWYSLAQYRDAFQWAEGAVGYHVASAEATSLHDQKGKYWVKSMIERGVIATLGPVSEPYLQSFPPPSLFFPLLMTGKYALAEVFAMTSPVLSWRMILVGDPLYNPFRERPAYFMENLPEPPQ
ncbi:MAG: TIGR03790 family protein [Nitrospiraceae bacterium]|nr:MAG: TIGR03790 family protein [Nitrospiraceae bacterium]